MSKYEVENIELVERNKPRYHVGASVYIWLGGAVTICVFLWFVAGRISAPPSKQSEPVLTEIAPNAAVITVDSLNETSWVSPSDPRGADLHHGYVYTYTLNERGYISLIEWMNDEARYHELSVVPISAGENFAYDVRQIAKERVGTQYNELYLLVADIGTAANDGVFIATVDGGVVRLLRMVTKEGQTRTAMFLRGATVKQENDFRMEDIDSDGVKEVIQEEITRNDFGVVVHRDVVVYKFKNNIFVYDQDLSLVMGLRDSLFPQPTAGSEVGSGN